MAMQMLEVGQHHTPARDGASSNTAIHHVHPRCDQCLAKELVAHQLQQVVVVVLADCLQVLSVSEGV